jgi:hypothetical protein
MRVYASTDIRFICAFLTGRSAGFLDCCVVACTVLEGLRKQVNRSLVFASVAGDKVVAEALIALLFCFHRLDQIVFCGLVSFRSIQSVRSVNEPLVPRLVIVNDSDHGAVVILLAVPLALLGLILTRQRYRVKGYLVNRPLELVVPCSLYLQKCYERDYRRDGTDACNGDQAVDLHLSHLSKSSWSKRTK